MKPRVIEYSIRLECRRLGMLLTFIALSGVCGADMPPPDYLAEVSQRAAATLETMNMQGLHEDAVAWGASFQSHIAKSADVTYEVAFALNAMGKPAEARKQYRRVLKLDPLHAAAWYDLGELYLLDGDFKAARNAFEQATRLRPDHWVGHFRLAEIAGISGDADAFNTHLKDALREGFSFRTVVDDPRWRTFFTDEELGDVIRRLITVYGDESLLEDFH